MEAFDPSRISTAAADLAASVGPTLMKAARPVKDGFRARLGLAGIARRTLGMCLLLTTVFLWTLSNFLASFIFSDRTYDKPFFLLYVNTSIFALSLLPDFIRYLKRNGVEGMKVDVKQMWREYRLGVPPVKTSRRQEYFDDDTADERLLVDDEDAAESVIELDEKLGFRETAMVSLEFCIPWVLANYFASACLEYTSVASVTILTSTSSVWTLILCAIFGVEPFSLRKLMGVAASLLGVVLISTVDLTGDSDENRGSFPHKTTGQIAIGDSMALLSAIIYGVYVTVMKRRIGDEDRVDMKLFFGLIGVINLAMLWPVFFILHWTGIETFELPPSGKIWMIIIANSLASYVSDVSWAIAMLLTTPLVVTVGLSLTIPLSLIGEMVQYGKYSSLIYWVGAAVVFVSFLFINHESHDSDASGTNTRGSGHTNKSSRRGSVLDRVDNESSIE